MREPLPTEIVEAIADAKGCQPTDLEFSLEDFIPTNALRQLEAHDGTSWTLAFEIPEHSVTVTGDGLILVDGTRENVWA